MSITVLKDIGESGSKKVNRNSLYNNALKMNIKPELKINILDTLYL